MRNYYYLSHSGDGWRNLATDEWLLDHLDEDELFLHCYINQNAVILGKNQNPWRECNLEAMDRDGVQLVRRVSGGGAVYHDAGNLNFSFIAGKGRYDVERQLDVILQAVRTLGIDCAFSGRNDLLAGGCKFSGNAFCQRGTICQHHGTLLIRADLNKLQRYLQVDPRKLQAKGVASVRSRVCNLSDLRPDLTVPVALRAVLQAFGRVYGDYAGWKPTAADRAEIETYVERHRSWAWRLGQTPQFDLELDTRFDWGGLQLLLRLQAGKIARAEVYSDAMDPQLPETLRGVLEGERLDSQLLSQAVGRLEDPQMRQVAQWLSAEKL